MLLKSALPILATLCCTAAEPRVAGKRYSVPEPDPSNMMIVEFAKSIDGTDGTPQSIGAKFSAGRQPTGQQPAPPRSYPSPDAAPSPPPAEEPVDPTVIGF